MAEKFDANSFDWSALWSDGGWAIPQMVIPQNEAKLKVFGTLKPEGFDTSYLNSAAHYSIFGTNTPSRLGTQEEYEKAFQKIKDDPKEYYKLAIQSAAADVGHTASLYNYNNGQVDQEIYKNAPEAEYKRIATAAIQGGYISPEEATSLSTPAYEQAYIKQSGYNNPDLSGGGGFLNKTLNAITSNPVTLFAVPLGAAALSGAFAGTAGAAGGTDYLGSTALGSAETGAVGTGSTGFGINAGASGVGINAGTGSLLATAPVESGFGISTTPPAGNFGEFNPNIGSGTTGSSGIGIDTGAATEGYLGAGSATDAASTSGLGYLGGADALPTGTAGLTTNVAADAGVSASDVLRGVNAVKSLLASPEVPQQPTGNKSFVPKGNINYDPLLNLLTMRASTPNLLSLLG